MLRKRGHRRIALGGHSGGAVRAAYAKATERFESVVAVIAVPPASTTTRGSSRCMERTSQGRAGSLSETSRRAARTCCFVREFHGGQRGAHGPT